MSVPIAKPEAPEPGEKFRILVVESDLDTAHLILHHLIRTGMEGRFAPDGLTGLTAFRTANPHLVITGITMPGMDGTDLCRKIREISMVPVLLLTEFATQEERMEFPDKIYKSGAAGFVNKPLAPILFHLMAQVIILLRKIHSYCYDEVPVWKSEPPSPDSPPPLMRLRFCKECNFVGRDEEFENQDSVGQKIVICPKCKNTEALHFPSADLA